jgi:hypothetical protein
MALAIGFGGAPLIDDVDSKLVARVYVVVIHSEATSPGLCSPL